MIKFAVKTLGCKVNQYETRQIEEQLCQAGFYLSSAWSGLDLVIINTCAVTHIAERKSRQFVRRAAKTNPDAWVFVTGCATGTDLERLEEILPVDFVYSDKKTLVKDITETFRTKIGPATVAPGHCRSYVMIQDGCDNYCAYCIVPHIRGGGKSRLIEEIVQESQVMIGKGAKEIILTGINLGSYHDRGRTLADVCRGIFQRDDGARLRLSSIEPDRLSFELIELMAIESRFCRHLHIPLQSGSDRILKQMGRKYSCEEYLKLLKFIRSLVPDIAITTDIIAGFPGETDEDFSHSLDFVRESRFSRMHIFPYSRRKGTRAADMEDVVADRIVEQRCTSLEQIGQQMREDFMSTFIGKGLEVLIEEEKNGWLEGYSSNYSRVRVSSENRSVHNIVSVEITRKDQDYLYGRPLPI